MRECRRRIRDGSLSVVVKRRREYILLLYLSLSQLRINVGMYNTHLRRIEDEERATKSKSKTPIGWRRRRTDGSALLGPLIFF